MRIDTGDLWTYPADYRVITTNSIVNAQGESIIGAGIALQAAKRYPKTDSYIGIRKELGFKLTSLGNFVFILSNNIISFPTKEHWKNKSTLFRIQCSAIELQSIPIKGTIVMPRPGCSNGGLLWKDVEKVISPILDDRFVVLL